MDEWPNVALPDDFDKLLATMRSRAISCSIIIQMCIRDRGQYIEKLSEYMASTGKRYQSHAATIRRWAGEDAKKAAQPTRNRDYSVKEDETV